MFFSVSSATLRGNLARKQGWLPRFATSIHLAFSRSLLLFWSALLRFAFHYSISAALAVFLSVCHLFFPFSCILPIVASDWLMVASQPAKQTDHRRRGPPPDCKQDGQRAVVRTMASFQQTQLVLVCYSFEGPSYSLFTKEMRTKNEGNGGTNRLPTITSNCKFTSEE